MLGFFRLSCALLVWFKFSLVPVFWLCLARLSCIIFTAIISVLSHLPEYHCSCSSPGGLHSTHFSHLVLALLINPLNNCCQSVSSPPCKIILFSNFCLLYAAYPVFLSFCCSNQFMWISVAGCSVAIRLFLFLNKIPSPWTLFSCLRSGPTLATKFL